jgi:hypothetical protein
VLPVTLPGPTTRRVSALETGSEAGRTAAEAMDATDASAKVRRRNMVSNSWAKYLADARERREPCPVLMTLAGEGRAGRRPAGVTHVPMASLRGWLVFLWQTS